MRSSAMGLALQLWICKQVTQNQGGVKSGEGGPVQTGLCKLRVAVHMALSGGLLNGHLRCVKPRFSVCVCECMAHVCVCVCVYGTCACVCVCVCVCVEHKAYLKAGSVSPVVGSRDKQHMRTTLGRGQHSVHQTRERRKEPLTPPARYVASASALCVHSEPYVWKKTLPPMQYRLRFDTSSGVVLMSPESSCLPRCYASALHTGSCLYVCLCLCVCVCVCVCARACVCVRVWSILPSIVFIQLFVGISGLGLWHILARQFVRRPLCPLTLLAAFARAGNQTLCKTLYPLHTAPMSSTCTFTQILRRQDNALCAIGINARALLCVHYLQ